jgi:translation initiation factor IF-3
MSKFRNNRQAVDKPSVVNNYTIVKRFNEVRVTGADGSALGVMSSNRALNEAQDQGLDLILVTEKATPPVCKITDMNKFLYERKRKEKEAAKKQRENKIELKEVQFRPNIDTHDFETKCRHVQRFVDSGALVKLMVRFRGREMSNTKSGYEIINTVLETIEGLTFDSKPQLNGNRLIAIVKMEK